jgi:hypothetical protein
MDYSPHAWLFVRGEESIRVTATPTGSLLIFGPGDAHQSFDFTEAATLTQFMESYQQRLLGDGWVLAIVAERRRADTPVSPEHERRARRRRKKPE